MLGGSLVVLIFEGEGDAPQRDMEQARALLETMRAKYEGEGPARKWLLHRYAVSYRQAPVFAAGLFSDTMEVAAPWSKLRALYDGVRRALGEHVFVMAHLSHAYPDGCSIYFTFAGTAAKKGDGSGAGWDERARLRTTARGRRRSPRRSRRAERSRTITAWALEGSAHGDELGAGGVDTVRALMRAFDPKGILNPGNLLPPPEPEPYTDDAHPKMVSA